MIAAYKLGEVAGAVLVPWVSGAPASGYGIGCAGTADRIVPVALVLWGSCLAGMGEWAD